MKERCWVVGIALENTKDCFMKVSLVVVTPFVLSMFILD